MGNKNFAKSLFSSSNEEEEVTKEEAKKRETERKLKENCFINKNSVDPKNGEKRLKIWRDSMGVSVEESYFWLMRFLRKGTGNELGIKGIPHGFGLNCVEVYKLKDVFDASVASSFHGQLGTKITAIQQQVSNTLAQIGQMTKTLFPIVREIRIMEERMSYYTGSLGKKAGNDEARQNEVTLKSTWIEVVEQGMQNPNSVYSMAAKINFVTLPDLFFSINPHGDTPGEQKKRIHKIITNMAKKHELNVKVRDALTKKLMQYYTWKESTYNEMKHTWKFRIKNLKQHYNVIRLYISWLKPYLTTLKQLQMKQDQESPDIVSSFESSKLELEVLGVFKRGKKYHACLLVRMVYVTRPDMTYTPQGQKQPTHVGHMSFVIEPYVATDEDIEFYKEHTDKETLSWFSGGEIDMVKDVEDAMQSLGEDVEGYLREAETGKREKDDSKVKVKKKSTDGDFFEPFTALMDSFKIFVPEFKKPQSKKRGEDNLSEKEEYAKAKKTASGRAWSLYDIYKKAHGLYTP